MPGRLAVDFGTSNTVLAVWDEAAREGVPLALPDYSRAADSVGAVPLIPSALHYAEDGRRWVGEQVHARGVYESPRTFRWMKRYVARRSPVRVRVGDRDVSHFDAGRDFLTAVLTVASAELDLRDEEVAFTVPVEAFEHYEDWLATVAEAAGVRRPRVIDEPSAAALGYGAHVQPGDVYLIFDFGGGTLDVSVVLVEEGAGEANATGRRCRVLGKAGDDLGGATIDQWLFQDVLRQSGRVDGDADVRAVSRSLLVDCERAKELLSARDAADVSVLSVETGAVLTAAYTRARFEEMLEERGLFARIDRTIRRALRAAHERGYDEEHVKAVLMVGGSSMVPSVQRAVRRIFGGGGGGDAGRVRLDRPLDAVARGAAAFVAGVDFFDHIQHDYAVRFVDPVRGEYDYRTIVARGTPYPTADPVAKLTVKASHDGQARLGIAVFEVAEVSRRGPSDASARVELVFDAGGAARVAAVSPEERAERSHFWLNEHGPTFLEADPAARQGEPRFEVQFGVDANKRLLVTARDLRSGRVVLDAYPMVKLT